MTIPATRPVHTMDRLLLGDNQFFGINHMSEERARAQALRFRDTESIVDVIEVALQEGVRTLMCTTHERIAEVCDRIRDDPARYPGFRAYPCMPYAHKYANAVTENGMLGAMRSFLPDDGALDALLKGGRSLLRKDVEGLIPPLIDAEMKIFHGLRTPVIFLQNVVVDLLLGLGFDEAFAAFDRHVRERYGAEPGFITMNLPMLLDRLDTVGLENPVVCANINAMGFRMSGGVEAYERVLAERPFRPVAMSVFASGAIAPVPALEWIHEHARVESIVFGASSRSSIASTVAIARDLWGSIAAPDVVQQPQ
ncbi:hypothetical protein R8Z57_12595 [Microbacterium sp. M3]|uniref:Uncharacterized protein n=1 Tax=Microbacterium arthrosphaerae TaxID=792652 RepID=A0ABU4H4K8_9MICO|nr:MULTISPECIES: hypothetical protein [Microbacterium]MDW4573614.1 hypothetical protein [Microbacterium arthrosphaerae]MDW7607469.1 hypothetical protein [Microbacterium sp. M3]